MQAKVDKAAIAQFIEMYSASVELKEQTSVPQIQLGRHRHQGSYKIVSR
jgi:hypothetical protein